VSILPLSFRGITFGWDERDAEHQARFADHEFPQKPGKWHEDMAAGARLFTFKAYLLANSVDLVRAKWRLFQKACANQARGTLMHPVFGALTVVCLKCKGTENRETLNRVDFDLTFEEDSGATQPIATRWIGAALTDAIASASEAISAGLDQVWNLVSMPAYVLDAAMTQLADLEVQITGTLGLLTAPVQAAVSGQASLLTGIVAAGGQLGYPIQSLFASFATDDNGRPLQLTGDQAAATSAALATLGTFAIEQPPITTPERAIAAMALEGLASAVRRSALLQEANVSIQRSFVSSDAAISVRDDLADRLDGEILAAADQASDDGNDVLAAIADTLDTVRVEMITDLTALAASLKPVAHITLKTTMPSDVLAYRLYGDGDGSAGARAATLTLCDDIASRNGVVDQGEMPGGVSLEYLAAA
jgi:prophage DNA circulation protein